VSRPVRVVLTVLRVGLGLGLLYYVLFRQGHWEAVRDFVATVWLLPALAGFTLFGGAIEAIRLSLLCRSQGIRLGFWTAYRLVVVAAFFGVCVPGGTGGDVIKLYYLVANNRGKGVEAATVLLVDRAVGMFTLMGVTLLLAALNTDLVLGQASIRVLVLLGAGLMAATVAAVAISWSTTIVRSRWFGRAIGMLPLHRYLWRAVEALHRFRHHRGALFGGAAVSMIGHAALCCLFLVAGAVMLPAVPADNAVFLSLLGMFANALPITPGGIGVGEAAFEALFVMLGFEGGARLILAWRAGMLPLIVLGALLYVARGAGKSLPAGTLEAGLGEGPGR